nr:MAG TPA: hypothetical protein [Caudoviricetes sp.]
MKFEQLPQAEQTIINSFELMEIIFSKSDVLEALDCLDEDLKTLEDEQSKPQEVIDYMKEWSKNKREAVNGMA